MVNKHIGFSESIVFHELEKIARRTNLIKDEPVIQKTASIVDEDEVEMLETSGNLFVDSIRLAEQLRKRGFEKQASSLEEKAVILKKAMSESGSDSLYDFWKETGESVVNFAHKSTDVDVAGYKPKNINEVRKTIESTLSNAPTGNIEKAVKMARKVEALLNKYADGTSAPGALKPATLILNNINAYNNWYSSKNGTGTKETEYNTIISNLKPLGLISDQLTYNGNAGEYIRSVCNGDDFLNKMPKICWIDSHINNFYNAVKSFCLKISISYVIDSNLRGAESLLEKTNPNEWSPEQRAFANCFEIKSDKGWWKTDETVTKTETISQENQDDDDWEITGLSPLGTKIKNNYDFITNEDEIGKVIEQFLSDYRDEEKDFTSVCKIISDLKIIAKSCAPITDQIINILNNNKDKDLQAMQGNKNNLDEIIALDINKFKDKSSLEATIASYGLGTFQESVSKFKGWYSNFITLLNNYKQKYGVQ